MEVIHELNLLPRYNRMLCYPEKWGHLYNHLYITFLPSTINHVGFFSLFFCWFMILDELFFIVQMVVMRVLTVLVCFIAVACTDLVLVCCVFHNHSPFTSDRMRILPFFYSKLLDY